MIVFVKGILEEISENSIIVDCNEIGYNIGVSRLTISNLPHIGETVKIYTYMNAKEDGVSLYGFLNKEELHMFNMLITVSGVGPKVSLGILSVIPPSKIMLAIISEDAETLEKAPGIGKKTAQRLVLELRDKIKTKDAMINIAGNLQQSISSTNKQEAIEALISLGYSRSEAVKAAMEVTVDGMTIEKIIKLALKKLAAF